MKFKVGQVKLMSGDSMGSKEAAVLACVLESPLESPNSGTINVASMGGIGEGMSLTLRVEPSLTTCPIPETFGISIITNKSNGAASGVWKRSNEAFKTFVDELKQAKMLGADFYILGEAEGDKLESTTPLKITQKLIFTGTEVVF